MTVETLPEASISTALANGEIAILYCSSSDINSARTATRRASTWLYGLSGVSNLRLCRSATDGMGVVAAHRECMVGIDIESLQTGHAFDAIAPTVLHPDEFDEVQTRTSNTSLSHVWVRKEATLKSFGVGLAVSPRAIVTGGYNEQWRAVIHGILGTAFVRSLKAPDGFAVGVALLGAEPASIRGFVYVSSARG